MSNVTMVGRDRSMYYYHKEKFISEVNHIKLVIKDNESFSDLLFSLFKSYGMCVLSTQSYIEDFTVCELPYPIPIYGIAIGWDDYSNLQAVQLTSKEFMSCPYDLISQHEFIYGRSYSTGIFYDEMVKSGKCFDLLNNKVIKFPGYARRSDKLNTIRPLFEEEATPPPTHTKNGKTVSSKPVSMKLSVDQTNAISKTMTITDYTEDEILLLL